MARPRALQNLASGARKRARRRAFCPWWSMGIQAGAKMSKNCIVVVGLLFLILALPGLGQTVVRVGALPNVTHAHAMVGKAIEALFPGAIDMSYVGSNPAIT